ncbi:MAG: transposase [Deltaproteobacteria bacterium]|nr:MAG: transposase [Deltaproteobacteria bacterium]
MSVKKTSFKLHERRYFSNAFKKEKADEILSKKTTIKELSILYEIKPSVIYRWLHRYSQVKLSGVKIHYEMETEEQKTLFYKDKVAELERIVGKKQIEIDFLNKLIEIASSELSVDIKKNFSTYRLNGSDVIRQKKDLP